MPIAVTVDELIAAFSPRILSEPCQKPRDPVERELLARLGDAAVAREQTALVRTAGERPTRANARRLG